MIQTRLSRADLAQRSRIRPLLALAALLIPMTLGLARPVSASLNIHASPPHAQLWRKLYDQLPAVLKTRRTVVVQEVSGKEIEQLVRSLGGDDADASMPNASEVDGCYQESDDSAPPTITLRETLHGQAASFVFLHEYGHFVWANKLNPAQRRQYARIWRTQKRNNRLITQYAGEETEEGFAESFSYYIHRPDRLRHRDTLSFNFLQKLFGKAKSSSASLPDNAYDPDADGYLVPDHSDRDPGD